MAVEEDIDKERNKDKEVKGGKSDEINDIESPIEVTVTRVSEAELKTSPESPLQQQNGTVKTNENPSADDSGEQTHGEEKGDNKHHRYVSQMSVVSSLSVREEINRSREQFFSNTSLNDSNLQEEHNKRHSATDEKFAEYHRKSRALKAQSEVEENVMSAEQMQFAVSRLEAVAARLETLAVVNVKHDVGGAGPCGK